MMKLKRRKKISLCWIFCCDCAWACAWNWNEHFNHQVIHYYLKHADVDSSTYGNNGNKSDKIVNYILYDTQHIDNLLMGFDISLYIFLYVCILFMPCDLIVQVNWKLLPDLRIKLTLQHTKQAYTDWLLHVQKRRHSQQRMYRKSSVNGFACHIRFIELQN